MPVLLVVLTCLLAAAAPAAAERLRTGWSGQQGFSHYFPLSPEEMMALQRAQRAASGQGEAAFVPRSGATAGGAPPSCGWAGCRGNSATPSFVGSGADGGFRDRCGWAGCRGSSATPSFAGSGADGGFRDRCGWAGCR